jgi:hypothetical protein
MGYLVLITGILLIIVAGGFSSSGLGDFALDDFTALSISGGLLIAGGVAALAHRWGVLIAWGSCGVALGSGLLRFFTLQTQLESLPNAIAGTITVIVYTAISAGIFLALTVELRSVFADELET